MEKNRVKYYFIADLHLGHSNILRIQPRRAEVMGINPDDPMAIKLHDKWIMDRWRETIHKYDYVFILGDFSFHGKEITKEILESLPGIKIMVWGNHDKTVKKSEYQFHQTGDIIEHVFNVKNKELDFLTENMRLVMSHYPMLSWNARMHGACHIHGHVHGNLDAFNEESGELRVDVGFDGKLSNFGFIELETIYKYFKNITGKDTFRDYIFEKSNKENKFY